MPQDWDDIVLKPQQARATTEEDEDEFVRRWLTPAPDTDELDDFEED
jgi:hypothetical protein